MKELSVIRISQSLKRHGRPKNVMKDSQLYKRTETVTRRDNHTDALNKNSLTQLFYRRYGYCSKRNIHNSIISGKAAKAATLGINRRLELYRLPAYVSYFLRRLYAERVNVSSGHT